MTATAGPERTPPGFSPEEWKIAKTLIDPVAFATQWLGANLWPVQMAVLRALATRPRVRVKACHASGKTFLAAIAALWWMTRFSDGLVITTAPSWLQVEKVLWGEIHRLLKTSKIRFPEPRKTELFNRADNYVMGMSTNEGVRFQGFHGKVLIIYDEAPGVNPEIYEAVEGIRAGGDVRELSVGNPVLGSGPFFDGFSSQREQFGDGLFTISAFDTPNLAGLTLRELLTMPADDRDIAPWPMLTTRQWVYERFFAWGGAISQGAGDEMVITEPTHPAWQSRVLGEFPSQAENALFSLAHLEAAKKRPAIDTGGRLCAGIDVAGPGEDETVLTIGDPANGAIVEMHPWIEADPRGKALNALEPYRDRLEIVNIDSDGMGYYFAKYIEDNGFPVKRVHVGTTANNRRMYRNKKAQFYWGLRMRAEEGLLSGLVDDLTIAQLSSHTWAENAIGQIEIESKESLRKRGVRSPDRAESLMLAFAHTSRSAFVGSEDGEDAASSAEPKSEIEEQFQASSIGSAYRDAQVREYSTCAQCAHYQTIPNQSQVGKCTARAMMTNPAAAECDYFEERGRG